MKTFACLQEYRPDRFSPENLEKMDNYAFVPFSAGPRYVTHIKQ